MAGRAKGWVEDVGGVGKREVTDALRVGSARLQATATLMRYRGPRLYQGYASACVAFQQTRLLRIAHAIQLGNEAVKLASPKFIYYNARMIEYAGQDADTVPPPIDRGCYPSLGLASTQRHGFCLWEDDPYEWTRVNEKSPNSAYRNAFDQSGLDWWNVSVSGLERSAVAAQCLKNGLPVGFGMTVDKAFEDVNSSEPVRNIDQNNITGGHAMVVLEVLDNGDVVGDNWWDDWGYEDGFCIISADLFGSHFVRNVHALTAAPSYTGTVTK